MRIEVLKEFREVAHNFNLTHSAHKLNITQSNLSKHMSSLEKELGFDLFVKNGRDFQLTPQGKLYSNTVAKILYELELCEERCRRIARDSSTEIKLRDSDILDEGAFLLLNSSRIFAHANPHISVDFVRTPSMTIFDALKAHKVDAGIAFCGGDPESYASSALFKGIALEPICKTPLVVWAHKTNPVFAEERIDLETLSHYNLMMPANRAFDTFRSAVHAIFDERDLQPSANIYTVSTLQEFFLKTNESDIYITTPKTLLDSKLVMYQDMISAPIEDECANFTFFIAYRTDAASTTLFDFIEQVLDMSHEN